MSIRPVDLNGMVQMTQDVSAVKQHEINRPAFEQHMIQAGFEKEANQQTQKVTEAEETQKQQSRYDAKEKGSNEYEQQGNKKKHKKEKTKNKIVVKGTNHSFDMKI